MTWLVSQAILEVLHRRHVAVKLQREISYDPSEIREKHREIGSGFFVAGGMSVYMNVLCHMCDQLEVLYTLLVNAPFAVVDYVRGQQGAEAKQQRVKLHVPLSR